MPQYSKTAWVDGTTPAIDATNLNKIEQGIFDSLRQDGSTTMSAQLVTIAGSAATPAIAPTGDSNTGIFFPAADTIAFGGGGAEAMRINSTGQVTVNNSLYFEGRLLPNSAASNGTQSAPTVCVGYDYDTGFFLPATNTLAITTGGTERMRINSLGDVGIGTTAPIYSLHVNESDTAAGSSNFVGLTSSSGGVFAIGVSDKSLANPIWNITTGSSEQLAFLVGATEKMRITSAGNVGIGTTSPSAEFHVKGTGEIARIETTTARGSGGNYLSFYDPTGVKANFGFPNADDNFWLINSLNGDMNFGTNNTNRLKIEAGGTVRPHANNTYDLGSSSFRWATIYAQNALNTSDARLKTDVESSSLGLDFIASLNPVQYRWIEGGNTVEKVQTGTEIVEITPAIPAQPELIDEDGNVIQEATEEVAAVTEERPIYEEVVTPREGVRTHFGLIAQEVKAALPDGLDFAGWCLADKDDADSTQSLGYMQLISPMIKAIQELKAEVDTLKAQLAK